jgi:hypothetical protein
MIVFTAVLGVMLLRIQFPRVAIRREGLGDGTKGTDYSSRLLDCFHSFNLFVNRKCFNVLKRYNLL